ncbi:hypothetical protein, partial [Streptomyces sparsus]
MFLFQMWVLGMRVLGGRMLAEAKLMCLVRPRAWGDVLPPARGRGAARHLALGPVEDLTRGPAAASAEPAR